MAMQVGSRAFHKDVVLAALAVTTGLVVIYMVLLDDASSPWLAPVAAPNDAPHQSQRDSTAGMRSIQERIAAGVRGSLGWQDDEKRAWAAVSGLPPRPLRESSAAVTAERYVTWEHNGGGLNNQLVTVAAAFDTARALNRTVFVRSEVLLYTTPPGLKPWHVVGIEEGLWDLRRLAERYRIAFESDVIEQYGELRSHPVLGRHLGAPGCTALACRGGDPLECLGRMESKCPVLSVGNPGGIVHFMEDRGVHAFFRTWRPAPYLLDAAERWLAARDWQTPTGRPHLSVHARTFWEGATCADGVAKCSGNVRKDLQVLFRKAGRASRQHRHDVASAMCFPTAEAINLVLERSGHHEHNVSACSGQAVRCRPWVLGSDGFTAGLLERHAAAHGAQGFNIAAARASGQLNRTDYRPAGIVSSTWTSIVKRLEGVYIDLYLLSQGEVFLGSSSSTFTGTVCKVRPAGALSNVCAVHTTAVLDSFLTSTAAEELSPEWKARWARAFTAAGCEKGGWKVAL